MYTIRLADGTKLTNVELNGNNYITKEQINEDIFSRTALTRVEITGETSEVIENAAISNLWHEADGTHIVFRQKNQDEIMREELDAKLEYIAMMADIEL